MPRCWFMCEEYIVLQCAYICKCHMSVEQMPYLLCVCVSDLAGSGVGVDAQWAVGRSRVVHHTHQLLPTHQLLNLAPGGHTVSAPRPSQRLRDEPGITLHLWVHVLILHPERVSEGEKKRERQRERGERKMDRQVRRGVGETKGDHMLYV